MAHRNTLLTTLLMAAALTGCEKAPAPAQAPAAPPVQAPAPAPEAAPDPIAHLKELGELHQSGVLTDEEFAAQKAKILNN